ncbi:MAG: ABC transporter permease [Aquabacterium sp.]
MTALLTLAARSAWNRRYVLALVTASVALATLLLVGIERLRADVRAGFSQAVSGTDLIVGARSSPTQLLLYAVFRIGNASANIRYSSAQAIAAHRAVAWAVPVALGDSHRGYPVLATTPGYFEHFRYGDKRLLQLTQGRPLDARRDAMFDVVLGAEVARRLGYGLGQRIVLSHGDGLLAGNDHDQLPFVVSGILAPTGTPVDRTLHIGLSAMEALHVDWVAGTRLPGSALSAEQALQQDFTPKSVTALLLGLKTRTAVFAVQRAVQGFEAEPLMGVLPGVALDELWQAIGAAERALLLTSALVALVSLAGLVATIAAGLNERRRELAILRAVGVGPVRMLLLLALEATLVAATGVALGLAGCQLLVALAADPVQAHWGLTLRSGWPGSREWLWCAAVLAGGALAGLIPGWRAYRMALADGLSPRL